MGPAPASGDGGRTPTQETPVRAIAVPESTETPAAMPPGRDLTVDALRALAIVAVAVGHWLVVVPAFAGGRFDGINALETVPLMRGLSWIFQVMPLFFVLGGFANAHSWRSSQRKGQPYPEWLRTRLVRLLRPSVAFVGVWVSAAVVLRGVGTDPELVRLMAWLAVVPVWFLAVYVVVVAAAPAMLALHDRFGVAVLVALAATATVVDAIRLGTDVGGVAWTNFFWVFLFAQQLGFLWVDGALSRSRWTAPALAIGGLVALAALTTVGPYPLSMVGVPGERIANNAPPTITLVALGLAQTGVAILARRRLVRLLERPAVLRPVVVLNVHAMTMLLWHFTALILAAVVILPLGVVPTYPDGSVAWWCTRIAAVVVLCGPLAMLVAVFGRVERGGATSVLPVRLARVSRAPDAIAPGLVTAAMLAATVSSAIAFALIAVGGLSTGRGWWGVPVVPVLLLAAAVGLTSVARREPVPTAAG
jgi:peptidoglycan/LPS O-acetylase OafA/YrhL